MESFEISDVRGLMNALLVNNVFDAYYVIEVRVNVRNSWTIGGKIDSSDDENGNNQYLKWSELKTSVFNIVRGKTLPKLLNVSFIMPEDIVGKVLDKAGGQYSVNDIKSLHMNLRFENSILSIISGTTLSGFSMDKTIEHAWDGVCETIIKDYE